jgi:hypothetical protein
MHVSFPQVSEKKKGLLPPELPRNKACNLVFKIAIQSHQVPPSQADGNEFNSSNILPPEQQRIEWPVCTNESNRTVWVSVHSGWPDQAGILGTKLDPPCLHIPSSSSQDSNEENSTQLSELTIERGMKCYSTSELDHTRRPTQQESRKDLALRTVKGEAELLQLQFGGNNQNLSAGPHTLVFESLDLPPFVVPFLAT